MFDDKAIDRHFQETEHLIRSTQRRFWTAFKWIGAADFVLVLAALFVAWKIWGS